MAAKDFLVEVGCAELPPKALRNLSSAFAEGVRSGLEKAGLSFNGVKAYATPRRLAVLVDGLQVRQKDLAIERFGPAVAAAYKGGEPTPAALGFARSCAVELSELETAEKDNVEKLVYRATQAGKQTAELLPDIVSHALHKLPIPKKMRWGSSREEFVRPVYWLVMLFGTDIIKTRLFGIDSGNQTIGHRFHHPEPLKIDQPSKYEKILMDSGMVVADYEKRKEIIREQVIAEGSKISARVTIEEDLLEEVTSLVEWPVALTGRFDEHFLDVPAEALVSSLKAHQKCFYALDENKRMLPYFFAVSNIESRDPAQVIAGNEKVIRPRLADAAFFYQTDSNKTLESHCEQLKTIVFQQQLGTVHDKTRRVATLAASLAGQLDANPSWCERAALLAKCDLVTNMVSEFAELQGIMGYYYALNDQEPEEVAAALNEQYMPRFAGDQLPATKTGAVLALAEKLDTIVGLFAIGQPPTGSKDPFALRRVALGVLRILVEKELDLDLRLAIKDSIASYQGVVEIKDDLNEQVFEFLLERFRAKYHSEGISPEVFQAVFVLQPGRPLDFDLRVRAVQRFSQLPESEALAAANKRVANILQTEEEAAELPSVDEALFKEAAEQELADTLSRMFAEVRPLFAARDYTRGLEQLASTRGAIDQFFDDVLVMCEDEQLRNNRLALLGQLRKLFLEVADVSCLHNA